MIPISNQDGRQAKNREISIFSKAAILNGGRGCQTQF
jgi:hypothetical protein